MSLLTGNRDSILDFCKLFGIDNPEMVRSFVFRCDVDSVATIEIERFVKKDNINLKIVAEKYHIHVDKIEEYKEK